MKSFKRAFSLVEVLAAVAIIGIIVFLALPNVIQAKRDTEEQMVITRAENLNMSISAYITAAGRSNAGAAWSLSANSTHAKKYDLIKGYLAYAPTALADYQPSGYTFEFGTLESKVAIKKDDGAGGTVSIAY
jgi:prepilin-type N-terminal cleavage/methylation domain-containing protein